MLTAMLHYVHRPQFNLESEGCSGMIRDAVGQSADANVAETEPAASNAQLDTSTMTNISHNFIVWGSPSQNDFAAMTPSEIPGMKAKEVSKRFKSRALVATAKKAHHCCRGSWYI